MFGRLVATPITLDKPEISPELWVASRRSWRGWLIASGAGLSLATAGLLAPGEVSSAIGIATGLALFFALPTYVVRWRLPRLETEVRAVSERSSGQALLGRLRGDFWVEQFAPGAWLPLQEAKIQLALTDGRAAARQFAEVARLGRAEDSRGRLDAAQAHALLLAGDRREAQALLEKLDARDLLEAADRLALGIALLSEPARLAEARDHLEGARGELGEHPRVLAALAVALERSGAPSKALELADQAEAALDAGRTDDPLATELLKRARKALRSWQRAEEKRSRRSGRRRKGSKSAPEGGQVSGDEAVATEGASTSEDGPTAEVAKAVASATSDGSVQEVAEARGTGARPATSGREGRSSSKQARKKARDEAKKRRKAEARARKHEQAQRRIVAQRLGVEAVAPGVDGGAEHSAPEKAAHGAPDRADTAAPNKLGEKAAVEARVEPQLRTSASAGAAPVPPAVIETPTSPRSQPGVGEAPRAAASPEPSPPIATPIPRFGPPATGAGGVRPFEAPRVSVAPAPLPAAVRPRLFAKPVTKPVAEPGAASGDAGSGSSAGGSPRPPGTGLGGLGLPPRAVPAATVAVAPASTATPGGAKAPAKSEAPVLAARAVPAAGATPASAEAPAKREVPVLAPPASPPSVSAKPGAATLSLPVPAPVSAGALDDLFAPPVTPGTAPAASSRVVPAPAGTGGGLDDGWGDLLDAPPVPAPVPPTRPKGD